MTLKKLNKIYHEDCLSTLKKMKDESVDLVITSPPYNMNLRIRNGEYCSRQIVKEISTKYTEFEILNAAQNGKRRPTAPIA